VERERHAGASKPGATTRVEQHPGEQHAGDGLSGKVIRSNDKVVHGTAGDDIIYGGNANQTIYGGGGNDIIIGRGGKDSIFGGWGNDKVRGGKGHDSIFGGRGNDDLRGDAGNDHLSGDIGDDTVHGGAHKDHLAGGMGIDKLFGAGGADVLSGDEGPDYVSGGKGRDTASFASDSSSNGVQVKPKSGKDWWANKKLKYQQVAVGAARADGGSGTDALNGVEDVVGADTDSAGSGTFGAVVAEFKSPNTGFTTLRVTAAPKDGAITNHVITVSPGKDKNTVSITGNHGVEVPGRKLTGKKSVEFPVRHLDTVVLVGGDGNDVLRVDGFKDNVRAIINGGKGNDSLIGGKGNDTLNDGEGNDRLRGGGGDDGLTNSAGKDRLRGGGGNDLLVTSSLDDGDVLDGGGGKDNASFAQVEHQYGVRAQIGGSARRIEKGKPHGRGAKISGSVEDLEGTERNDVHIGNGKDNNLLGRGGADTLQGRGGSDVLDARSTAADGSRDPDRRLDGGAGHDASLVDAEDRKPRNAENISRNKRHH
jgi:Ca2+-binding RTX toxin-like protein